MSLPQETPKPAPPKREHLAPTEEIRALFRRLGDRLIYVVLVLGTLSLGANTWRASAQGWSAAYFVDLAVFVGILGALSLRRRIAPLGVFWAMVALAGLEGLVRLATFGLGGGGTMILSATCMFVGVFMGLRRGLMAMAIAFGGFAAIGVAHEAGLLGLPDAAALVATSPRSWATHGGLFAAFTVTVLYAASSVQQRLLGSLAELKRRTVELGGALERLGESERKHRALAEQVTDVVFVQDMDLRPVYASPSVRRLFGYEVDEATALSMAELLTPASLAQAIEDYRRYLALACEGPVEIPLVEYEYLRKDGSTFWGELQVTFLRDEQGRPTGSQGVLRDVTWRKQAEQERERLSAELRHAEKMQAVGQLASGIAHDFNNQLAVIQGYAELAGLDSSAPPSVRHAVDQVVAAARRSADLTAQLLAFGRRGAARSVPVDVHALVAEVVGLLERGIDRRIRLRTELAASEHTVQGDPSQLSTALLNLGLNARDALPEGGEIVIATRLLEPADDDVRASSAEGASRRLEVKVIDTGVGMSEEICNRIFEPFFTTKPVGRGTGMGLAAVYGTVTTHGGTVAVESSPGCGTTIAMQLPLLGEAAGIAAVPATAHAKVAGQLARVLLLDDEPQVCAVAKQMLEAGGYAVHAFTDADEATAFHATHLDEVDIAVLDLSMPTMTGTQCLAALRARQPSLPALFVSGDTPPEDAKQLVDEGSCAFLPKPFSVSQLCAETARLLEHAGGAPGSPTSEANGRDRGRLGSPVARRVHDEP